MRITRHNTELEASPYDGVAFGRFPVPSADIAWFEAPVSWSREAVDLVAARCAVADGLAGALKPVPEADVPQFLWRHEPDAAALAELPSERRSRGENGLCAIIDRIAGAWSYWGWKAGYFDAERDARAFFDEIRWLLCHQRAAPELALWRRVGLNWAYGLDASGDGCFLADYRTGAVRRGDAATVAPSGAVITGVTGDPAGETGLWSLCRTGAGLAALGCPAGVDLSALTVADAGLLSGMAAPATAGRRMALSHRHEFAAGFASRNTRAAMDDAVEAVGRSITLRHARNVVDAAAAGDGDARRRFALGVAAQAALPPALLDRVTALAGSDPAETLLASIEDGGAPHRPAESLITVLAIDDAAMEAARDPGSPAGALLDATALSAWTAGAAGLHFSTTADRWHGCAGDGAVSAAAGDGDFLFLDDTAAGRAVIGAGAWLDDDGALDVDGLRHAARLMTIALDIALATATYPTPRMARRVWDYRPLALSVTGLASLLTSAGVAYDSDAGRSTAAAVCALITGAACAASGEMAAMLGPFPRWAHNRDRMAEVAAGHARAASKADGCIFAGLAGAVRAAWSDALAAAQADGFRNAQVTAIFPAADETRLLDAGSRGLEPNGCIVRYERLEGGGHRRTVAPAVERGLRALGYDAAARAAIVARAVGRASIERAPGVNHETLRRRGFTEAALARIEAALADVSDVRQAFHKGTLGSAFCLRMLGFATEALDDPAFDMLAALGFSDAGIEAANIHCCGSATLEDAPYLAPEHKAVFDCARPAGERGRRSVSPEAVIRMAAAVQPVVSGGVGHTVTLPHAAPVAAFRALLLLGWQLGLRTLTLTRATADAAAPDVAGAHEAPVRSAPVVGLVGPGRPEAPAIERAGRPMSQPLALAHTAAGVSGGLTTRKRIAARPDGVVGDASPSRRESPDSPRSAASVSSSADAVVEQRQV